MAEHEELSERYTDMFDVRIRIFGSLDNYKPKTKRRGGWKPEGIDVTLSKYDLERAYENNDKSTIEWLQALVDIWNDRFEGKDLPRINSKSDLKGLYLARADEMGVDVSIGKFGVRNMNSKLGEFRGYRDSGTKEPIKFELTLSDHHYYFNIDYADTTIVHELAHVVMWQERKKPGHDSYFWGIVNDYMPDYDAMEKDFYIEFSEAWGEEPYSD